LAPWVALRSLLMPLTSTSRWDLPTNFVGSSGCFALVNVCAGHPTISCGGASGCLLGAVDVRTPTTLFSQAAVAMSATLTDAFLDMLTSRLRAIAEPTRIRLLAILEQREATVQELSDELGSTHQHVSKHLGVLHRSGIVSRRRSGNRVWYALADYSACRLIDQATASLTGYVEELASITGLEAAA
jgi:DNA-binding transcriptional ArsR family regulator